MMFFAIIPMLFASAQIDLAGEWILSGADRTGKPVECAAAVPGGVHSALLRAQLIEDPFWGCNETNLQWIGYNDWTLTREFDLTPEFLAHDEIVLRAEDVDCFAEIYVNDRKAAETCDRFLRWQFDVKPYLRVGKNTIRGVFRSAIRRGDELAARYWRNSTNDVKIIRFEHEWAHNQAFVRKNACHKGWDWGLSQMVTGFCGPVKLIASGKGKRVEYVYADTKFNEDMSHCTLTAFAEMSDGTVVTNREEIANPPLWWPAGQGKQNFHTYSIAAGGEKIVRRIGLRKIEVDCTGGGMVFKVNGRAIFMKGANWIPCSAFECEQTSERYRDLLESAAAANMNMIRLWGGGQYEKDCFYDICDELGLLVWHDQMFACGSYPSDDPKFADLVGRECAHQLRRLRDHASIALWCGGNECKVPVAIQKAMVAKYDPARLFWPSSPCAGPDDLSGTTFGSADSGDSHNWEVWHFEKPFEEYYKSRPRFCSEFGFQSLSSREVAATFCPEAALKSGSPEFEWHQKNKSVDDDIGGNDRIRHSFARCFRMPKDFDSMLYLSQVQQGVAIKTAVEGWRTLRPYCMGTLFWQLNDNWPVASWSSVEYGGKWKPLHHMARRFYAPVAVVAQPEIKDGNVDVTRGAIYALNDTAAQVEGELTAEYWTYGGKVVSAEKKKVSLPPGSSSVTGTFAKKVEGKEPTFLVLTLKSAHGEFQNDWHFGFYKDMPLADAKVKVGEEVKGEKVKVKGEGEGGGEGWKVVLSTDKPAFFVWVNACGIRGEFDDNSLTLLPGRSRTLTFNAKRNVSIEDLRKALKVTHLRESYSNGKASVAATSPIRKGFKMRLHPGMEEEYTRRHNELWPEMKAMIHEHGGRNYSIFLDHETNVLYGYIEIEDEAKWAKSADTPICRKWWDYMAPLMEVNPDNSPVAKDLVPVFYLD